MKRDLTILTLLALLLISCGETTEEGAASNGAAEGSSEATTSSTTGPGGMTLLEGYQHVELQAASGDAGRISRPRGPILLYNIGWIAGNFTESHASERGIETRVETEGDRTITIAESPDGIYYLTVTKEEGDSALYPANFQSPTTDKKVQEEFLEMVRTYNPE